MDAKEANAKTQNEDLVAHQNVQTEELLETLERKVNAMGFEICLYDGFWFSSKSIEHTIRFQKHFVAHDTDIMLCTNPKCGTTWLKAFTFSIAKRGVHPVDQSPLLITNPQELVPSLNFKLYALENNIPSPRIYSSHIPYSALPSSVRDSKCRILYICRNPLDQFISLRHFRLENGFEMLSFDQDFDMFCEGAHIFGPFWDHVLGFWEASVKDGCKVLFLKYEDLKEDIGFYVRKIAEFIGMPFSAEEEEHGLVEQIAKLCSFENLKSLKVNKDTDVVNNAKSNTFFRKGQVGDWRNSLTPSMAKRYEDILESKLKGSGLKFRFS